MKTTKQLAREAGARYESIGERDPDLGYFFEADTSQLAAEYRSPSLERFAALVRADERERCFLAIVGDLPKDGPGSDYEIAQRRAAEKVRLLT